MISSASQDPRFANHPGLGILGIQSYVAVPLFRRDGRCFGTLCAFDHEPAELSAEIFDIFHLLASLISFELEEDEEKRERQIQFEDAQRNAGLREQFIGVLGHDLRTPVTVIKTGTSMLLRDATLPEQVRGVVARLAESADRMTRMLADLTDVTRGRLGAGMAIAPIPTDLGTLCRRCVQELEMVHPGRTMNLELQGDLRGAWDPVRMSQVVSNLLTNAIQYSPTDTAIDVKASEQGMNISLEVHNHGDPIPPDLQQQLFDPFQRGAAATQKRQAMSPGLGLGLYIVQQIVNAHGGTVSVHSAESKGTTFTVQLPRHLAAPD